MTAIAGPDRNNNMSAQTDVEPPLTLRFEVPLKDFVRHRYLNAKLSAQPNCNIGELIVSLERTDASTSTEIPNLDNNLVSTSVTMSSADFMDVGVSIPQMDEIDEEVGVTMPRIHIAAKDHMQFLIHHFSKRRKLKKRYVKNELLGFKRAVLRDYGSRVMKFTLAFDNFRQIAPPATLHQLLMSSGAPNRFNMNNIRVAQAASVPQNGIGRPEAMSSNRLASGPANTVENRRVNATGSGDAGRLPSVVPKGTSTGEQKTEPSSSNPNSDLSRSWVTASQLKANKTSQQSIAQRNISSTAAPESSLRPCPPLTSEPVLAPVPPNSVNSNCASTRIANQSSVTAESENDTAAHSLAPSNDFLDQYLTIGGPLQSMAQMSADMVPDNNTPATVQPISFLPMQSGSVSEQRPITTQSPQPEPDSSTSATLAQQSQPENPAVSGTAVAAVTNEERNGGNPLLSSLLSTGADCSHMSPGQANQIQTERSSNVIQIVSVSTLAEGTISPIPPGISNTEGTVSSSTSPQQQQNQQLSNVERNGIVGSVSVLTRGRGRGTTAASAIDLAQSGDEDEEDVDSSAPPAKRIATEIKKEPDLDCNAKSCQSDKDRHPSLATSATVAVKSQPDSRMTQTCASQCSSTAVANPSQLSSNEQREYKCWLCDFTYTEFHEIEAHLKNNYQKTPEHFRDRMALLFGLDNPSILLLSENCAVHLKCLKCDQVQTLLSHYIIHVMMLCPFSHTGRVQHSSPYRTNVFDMIQVVEKANVRSEEFRELIKGVNEISICGHSLSCGSLLNKFDVRPHKCDQKGGSSGNYKLKCSFQNCPFEGEKKELISHYCFSHAIRLTNVNLPQEEEEFLARSKTRKLEHLLTGPLVDWYVYGPAANFQPSAANANLQMPPQIRPVVVPGPVNRPPSVAGSSETLLTGSVGDSTQVHVSVGPRPQTSMPSLVSQQHRQQNRFIQQARHQQTQQRQYQNQIASQQFYLQQPSAPMTTGQQHPVQSSNSGIRTQRTNTAIRSAVPQNTSHSGSAGHQFNPNYSQAPRVTNSIVNQQQMYPAGTYPTPAQTHVNYGSDPRVVPNVQAPQLYFHPQSHSGQAQRAAPNAQATTTNMEHYYQSQQHQQQQQVYSQYTYAQATQPISNQTFAFPPVQQQQQQNVQQSYSYQQQNYYTPQQQQ